MCILLFYINNGGGHDDYQLVLGMNRDEFFERPTKQASFWGNDPVCIGGLDAEPGKEGGTWFGASKSGKIAALLNILEARDLSKKGRGFFVINYLMDKELTAQSYMNDLVKNVDDHNGFNLVLFEKVASGYECRLMCSKEDGPSKMFYNFTQGCHAVSNSSPRIPWEKAKKGRIDLDKLMSRSCKTADKDSIIDGMFSILSQKDSNLPDNVLEETCSSENVGATPFHHSSICINGYRFPYGTRTQTVILVKKDGTCDFIEKTMSEPIQKYWEDNIWTTHEFTFKMGS